MPHTDSADLARRTNQISPRGQRSGCWVTQKIIRPEMAALKDGSQSGWLTLALVRCPERLGWLGCSLASRRPGCLQRSLWAAEQLSVETEPMSDCIHLFLGSCVSDRPTPTTFLIPNKQRWVFPFSQMRHQRLREVRKLPEITQQWALTPSVCLLLADTRPSLSSELEVSALRVASGPQGSWYRESSSAQKTKAVPACPPCCPNPARSLRGLLPGTRPHCWADLAVPVLPFKKVVCSPESELRGIASQPWVAGLPALEARRPKEAFVGGRRNQERKSPSRRNMCFLFTEGPPQLPGFVLLYGAKKEKKKANVRLPLRGPCGG